MATSYKGRTSFLAWTLWGNWPITGNVSSDSCLKLLWLMLKYRSLMISSLLLSTANNIQNTTKLIISPPPNIIYNNDITLKLYILETKLVQIKFTKNTEMGSVKNFTQRFLEVRTFNRVTLQANRLWISKLKVEPRSFLFICRGKNKYYSYI